VLVRINCNDLIQKLKNPSVICELISVVEFFKFSCDTFQEVRLGPTDVSSSSLLGTLIGSLVIASECFINVHALIKMATIHMAP